VIIKIIITIYDIKDIIKGHRRPKVVTIKSNLIEEGSYKIREFGENKFLLEFAYNYTTYYKYFIVDKQ
jgi:hypothetical protein